MDIYNSENEQIDAVRNFFRENGIALVVGIVLGVGGLFGWRFWQAHQINTINATSVQFETLVTALNGGDSNAESALANFVVENKNSYGAMAALELAKHFVDKGDLTAAQQQLERAVVQIKDRDMQALAHLRLARIQFVQGQPEQALATLSNVKANSWAAEAGLIRGNIYLSQNKADEAKSAYNAGLVANPSQFVESQLRLQLERLGA